MLPYQLAAACLQFMLSTHIIHNLRLALLHFIIFATYLKSWHSQKKLTNFISARVTHQGTNNSLSWRPTCLHCCLARGGKAECALRVGGHLCELSFVRFISHKQISGVVYLYRKRANNAPGTRRSRVLESSTCSTISLTLPQSPLLWPPLPPASRTVLTFFPAFFFCFFLFSSTNYVAKKKFTWRFRCSKNTWPKYKNKQAEPSAKLRFSKSRRTDALPRWKMWRMNNWKKVIEYIDNFDLLHAYILWYFDYAISIFLLYYVQDVLCISNVFKRHI